jgi:hypothetical protein
LYKKHHQCREQEETLKPLGQDPRSKCPRVLLTRGYAMVSGLVVLAQSGSYVENNGEHSSPQQENKDSVKTLRRNAMPVLKTKGNATGNGPVPIVRKVEHNAEIKRKRQGPYKDMVKIREQNATGALRGEVYAMENGHVVVA